MELKILLLVTLSILLAFGSAGLMLARPQPVKADITCYYVNDDYTPNDDKYCQAAGDDANNDGRSAGKPKRTIQAIIEAYDLEPGDIVYVDAGTYAEHISIGTEDSGLTLQGAGAGLTIIDGSATGRCLYLNSLTQATIDGFTFKTGGAVDFGGGMYIFE